MVDKVCTMNPPNRVADDGFKGKTLFVSGMTGFLGKVLMEKLLRTCPVVKKIYALVRPKKGKSPQERLKEIFTSPLFNLLKQTHGEEILNKIVAVKGDLLEPGLGMSPEDRKIVTIEAQIIYHMAASIRFDLPFGNAVLLNTRGTKRMLDLAKEVKNLQVFVHVSTSYCHLRERLLNEKPYPPPADPHVIMKIVETMSEEVVNGMAEKIMGDYPNSYAFTKALGEGLVNEQLDTLPIIILRPSVVIPIWKEPLPGWTDNINGPAGLLIAAGKGVLRSMYCDSKSYADFLPVDVAASAILVMTYDYLATKRQQVYNLTSSFQYKITWSEIVEMGRHIVCTKMPLNWVVWYPGGSMKSSRLLHNVSVLLFHYIPAIFLDAIIVLSGNKPILWRVQQRITKGCSIFEFYANNQWDFANEGTIAARDSMNESERKIYKMDGEGLDIENYFYTCIHATRLFILKESDESISTARRHMTIMWAVDKICKTLILFGFIYLILRYFVFPILGMEF